MADGGSEYRPRLRSGLTLLEETAPSSGDRLRIALADPPQQVQLRFGQVHEATLELLDGRRSVSDVLRAAAARGVAAAETRSLLLSLMLTNLLEGVGDEARRARIEAFAAGPDAALDLPFQVLPDTRFECGACGACCRSYSPGPISLDEMQRIEGAAFVRDDPELRGEPLFVLKANPDVARREGSITTPVYTLRTRADGSCVFLMADNRCRIHAELGYEAKPDVCKLFPWVAARTERALVVSDRTECQTFTRSATEGPPLEERLAGLAALLRRSTPRWLHSPVLHLPGGIAVAHATFRPVVERLAAVVDDAGQGRAFARLAACRDALAHFLALVHSSPLGPGAPEALLAAFEAIDVGAFYGPDAPGRAGLRPEPDAFRAALARLLRRVALATDRLPLAAGPVASVERTDALVPLLVEPPFRPALRRLFRRGVAVLLGDEPGAPVDLGDATLDGALRRALRARLHGHELEVEGTLLAGFARSALVLLTTVGAARAAARERGAPAVAPGDLDRGQFVALRAFTIPAVRRTLAGSEPDLQAVFEHASGAALEEAAARA